MHARGDSCIVGSVGFLKNYMESLFQIRHGADSMNNKGKAVAEQGVASCAKQGSSDQKLIWEAPPSGWCKIDVDGAFCDSTSSAGVDVVVVSF